MKKVWVSRGRHDLRGQGLKKFPVPGRRTLDTRQMQRNGEEQDGKNQRRVRQELCLSLRRGGPPTLEDVRVRELASQGLKPISSPCRFWVPSISVF